MTGQAELARWAAAARLHHRYLTGLVLHVLRERGTEDAAEFLFRTFRAQHDEKFVAGLRTLGLDTLPPAVACAQYIYLANKVGGVKVEFMPESDTKAWVRYPPPRWIWDGAVIAGIPSEISWSFPRAFHSQAGASLGNARLGFVVTKVTTDPAACLEGYFREYDHDLGEDERLQHRPDEDGPDFDPEQAPTLDWSGERLAKARRNYAIQYIRVALPALWSVLGDDAERIARNAGYLIGLHTFHETATLLELPDDASAACFRSWLAEVLRGGGDVVEEGENGTLVQNGWRMMAGRAAVPDGELRAWAGLFEGAAAACHRHLQVRPVRSGSTVNWHIGTGLG